MSETTDTNLASEAADYSHLAHANDLEPAVGHHHLLEHLPLHRETNHEPPFCVVSRYDDVLDVLLAPQLWNNGTGPGVFVQTGGVLGSADDPDHRRQRRVLQDAFRPRAIEALLPRVDEIGQALWDSAFAGNGEGDFVQLFAFPFPAIVIAELLGVPADERDHFGEWSDDIVRGLGGGDAQLVVAARDHIHALVDRLLEERLDAHGRGEPHRDDVIGVLTGALLDGAVRRDEVRQLCLQLLVAGHETTASLIGLMLYRLVTQPDLLAQLRAEPHLVPMAVEEFLRYDSPVQGLFRTNAEDCPVRGETIQAGTKLQVLYAAANRDPRVWDDPDELRLDRHTAGARPHVAFGWGVHHCIGAPLARQEGQLALRMMIERFATVELIGDVEVNDPFILRGLTTLPIRWTVR